MNHLESPPTPVLLCQKVLYIQGSPFLILPLVAPKLNIPWEGCDYYHQRESVTFVPEGQLF